MTTITAPGAGGVGADPNAGDWRAALLRALGAPVTSENMAALSAWQTSEGTNPSGNNWLAITDPGNKWPHAGVIANNGGNPVYAFPSQAIGAEATAAFLRGSYYRDVVAAFTNDVGLAGIYKAINASPWCKGCQNGNYPIALHEAVNGGGLFNFPGFQPGSPGGAGSTGDPNAPTAPAGEPNRCLIGDVTNPGPIPNIPCLLTMSQARGIIGALVLVSGGVLLLVGVYMAATGGRPSVPSLPSFGGTTPMRPQGLR